MNNQKNSNSNLPIAIIGLVLVVAVVGGWFWYSSTARVKTNNSNSSANKTPDANFAEIYAKSSPGANPPWLLGSQTATVTVEEFADFQCGTCATKHSVVKEIVDAYGSRIKFIFRHYPLQNIHQNAFEAAVAAEAAGMQGKFWEMQHQLFTNQASWSGSTNFGAVLEEYAKKIGLDVEKFKSDMRGLGARARVDLDIQRGRSLRLTGTPSFFINGKPLDISQTTVEGMKQIIDAELQKTKQ